MPTKRWKKTEKPTEAQKKFFERNKLVLPPTALIAENIIASIQEEEGARYLQKIELVRSLQNLIGITLDTGETIEYVTLIPFAKRSQVSNRPDSRILAGLRAKKGDHFQRGFERCLKGGSSLLPREYKNRTINWERYWLFREELLRGIERFAKELTEADPKWKFEKCASNVFGFWFWVDPKKVPGNRAVSTTATEGAFQYALVQDNEANQIGELIARLPLPDGVKIQRLPIEGVCAYKFSINPDLFLENPS